MESGSKASPESPRRSSRAWRVVFLAVASLPVGLALFLCVLNWIADGRVATALSGLEADGFTTRLEELAPPLPDPLHNGAPLVMAAARTSAPPEPGEGWIDYVPIREQTPENRRNIDRVLARHEQALDLVRGARLMGKAAFHRDWRAGWYVESPEISFTHYLATLLNLKARVCMEEGRVADARRCLADIFWLADVYRAEPLKISQLVRMNILKEGVDSLGHCVTGRLKRDDVEALRDLLPAVEDLDGAAELAFRGDVATAAQIARFPSEFMEREVYRSEEGGSPWGGYHILTPLFKFQAVEELGRLRRAVDACAQPYPESARRADEIVREQVTSGADNLFRIWGVEAGFLIRYQVRTQAMLAVTRAGLDFELRYLEKGAYPEALVTADPCTGRPLRYHRESGTISSAGLSEARPPLAEDGLIWNLRHH